MSFAQQVRAYAPLGRRSAIVTLQLLTTLHLISTDLAEIRLCAGFSMLPTLSHTGDFVLISPLPLRFHTSASGVNGHPSRSTDKSSPSIPSGLFNGIKRGDIVIATSPTDPGKTVCKRVVGMEGDIIEVDPSRSKMIKDEVGARPGSSTTTSSVDNRRWEEIDADHRRELSQARRDKQPNEPTSSSSSSTSTLVPVFPIKHKIDNEHVRIPKGYVWLAGDNLSNSTDSRAYGPVPMGMLKGKVFARVWPDPKWLTGEQPMREIAASS